jgi:hypothetical protein
MVGKPEIEPFGRDWRYISIALIDPWQGILSVIAL